MPRVNTEVLRGFEVGIWMRFRTRNLVPGQCHIEGVRAYVVMHGSQDVAHQGTTR